MSELSDLYPSKCQTPLLLYKYRKLIKVINKKGQKMTNRIYEKDITPTMAQLMGYNKCEKCGGGWIAQPVCVMCR